MYYGQVGYLNSDQELVANTEEQVTWVRHGFGVQLFRNLQGEVTSKYEGQWVLDRKQGTGACVMDNGDQYEGDLLDDRRHGQGKYVWSDHMTYEGQWERGQMQGKGLFSHPSGIGHKGEFKANYFLMDDFIVNPFLNEEKLRIDLEQQAKYRKLYTQLLEGKKKEVHLHRPQQIDLLQDVMRKIEGSERVPFVLFTKESGQGKDHLYEKLGNVVEIDLRQIDCVRKQSGREEARAVLKGKLLSAATEGAVLVLNLDESLVKYEELYYPDLYDLFSPTSFPHSVFTPHTFKRDRDAWNTFRAAENYTIHQDFSVVVYSKTKLEEGLEDSEVLRRFKRKFARVVPLDNIDCILVSHAIEEEPLEEEENPPED